MRLSELSPANDVLTNPAKLAARWEQERCLLVRGAVDPSVFADITGQAGDALRRCGVARPDNGRWTGTRMPHADETGLNDIPALDDFVARVEQGDHPLGPVVDQVCGHPMHIWSTPYLAVTVPDDPAYATAPHQDGFAKTDTGDYRRLWIALSDIAYGDGGLAFAIGSHRKGHLPSTELSEFQDRSRTAQTTGPRYAKGVDPRLVDDHWHTAAMRAGDLLVFHLHVVHRSLPATSDNIRMALFTIASGKDDPRPKNKHSRAENRARLDHIRELTTSLDLSDAEVFRVNADLSRTELPVNEKTVRSALSGAYAPTPSEPAQHHTGRPVTP